jgi:hypothetical protein
MLVPTWTVPCPALRSFRPPRNRVPVTMVLREFLPRAMWLRLNPVKSQTLTVRPLPTAYAPIQTPFSAVFPRILAICHVTSEILGMVW